MQLRGFVIPALIGALVAGFAGTASADFYSVGAANKNFCCSTPLVTFTLNAHTVMGLATGSPATKYGPIHFDKSQAVYGMNMRSWWSDYPLHGSKAPPAGFKYVLGSSSVVNTSGTLQSGGGYGTFDFCPKAVGPGPAACANPGLATGGFNGRISVKAGTKKFGGTMKLVAGLGGGPVPGGSFNFLWRWIGGSMTYPAALVNNVIGHGVNGNVPAAVSDITQSSAVVTHTVGSSVVPLLTHTAGSSYIPLSFPSIMLWENGAGPWTTGTVNISVTQMGTPLTRTVTLMGYNNRTAAGGGNLQVVSGLLFNGYNTSKPGSYPLGYQLNFTLPEPSANLGLAAGSAALLLIGLVASRRGSRNRQDG